jgi:dTDP-glucose 4,6-dehydratase
MSLGNYQPRNMLVTGGSGFIGTNLIRYFLQSSPSFNIINLDKLTYAATQTDFRNLNYTFIQGDIADVALVDKILRQHAIDTIVHLAAESHVDRSIATPAPFVMTNVVGTFVLLDAARRYWLEEKSWQASECRFHHVSTDEVYGALNATDNPFHENSAYLPSSPYSASKAGADHLVRAYHHTYQLPVSLSHCSNNYGPHQHREKFIPTVINAGLAQQPMPIYGDGSNIRDWLYVEDHCIGIEKILQHGRVGDTYHLGGESEMNNLQIANQICALLDEAHPKGAPHARLINLVQDRRGHDWRYAMNIDKVRAELNWVPRETFATGIMKTLSFYLKNYSQIKLTTRD